MSAAVERRHWHFTGSVQGVGFRYRAQYAAQLLDLTGWVENNWDGTVDLEAQGSAAQLDRLVPTITGTSHWIHIETFTCKSIPPDPAERSFRVRGQTQPNGRGRPPLGGPRAFLFLLSAILILAAGSHPSPAFAGAPLQGSWTRSGLRGGFPLPG